VDDANLPPHVRRVLDLFPDARRSADGWLVHCPCPDHGTGGGDQNPSVKIDLRHDGGVLLCCRTGCRAIDILDAVGLEWPDLFAGPADAPPAATAGPPEPSPPDAATRHQAYTAALAALTLSDAHRDALRRRGLSDGAIVAGGYRTLRNVDRKAAAAAGFAAVGDALFAVPGFVPGEYGPTVHGTAAGLVVPVRDAAGRVAALKVRQAEGREPKYYLVTSGTGGPALSGLVHVPLGTPASAGTVRVTEGELKADVAAARGDLPTVGAPGVTQWAHALPVLAGMGVKTVVVAFDAPDVRAKVPVREACGSLVAALRDAGFGVELEDWEGPDKGIDDLLAAGGRPRRLTGPEVDRHLGAGREPGEPSNPWPAQSPSATWPVPTPPVGGAEDPPGPTPLPSISPTRMPFPVDAFPAPLAAFARAVAAAVGCPVDYPAAAMLAVAGAAAGAARALRVKAG